jgi:hypothetical protein
MATPYSLDCVNNSDLEGSFAVFQGPAPNDVPKNSLALAWQVRAAPPRAQVTFEWTLDHGVARPGYWVVFGNHRAGQVLDPDSIIGPVEVPFSGSLTSRTVTLQPNNTLTVS